MKKYIVYRASAKKNGVEYVYYGSTSKTLDDVKKYWRDRCKYDQISKMLQLCHDEGVDAFEWSVVETADTLGNADMKRVLCLRRDLAQVTSKDGCSVMFLNRTKGLIPIDKVRYK